MKFMKYVLAIAFILCATASNSHAQTVQFLGGGSSALFLELGQASQSVPGVTCIWSSGKSANILARDARFSPNLDEQGNYWVAWGPGTGSCAAPAGSFNIYSYEQLDSVVGDRCYFEVDSSGTPGCIQILTVTAGTAGANKITGFTDTPIPASVISAVNSKHYFVAGTDVRPEDAKFATLRMFTPCDQLIPRQPFNQDSYFTNGLGYASSTPNLGVAVLGFSGTGGGSFNVANFNIIGNDPVTNIAVPNYATSSIGAQPILVAVAPFPASPTGLAAASDIPGFTLDLFYQGVLARSTDLQGPTTTNPVDVIVREPLSGTYNTFEYSIPNGTQYHATQEYGNCNGSGTVFQNPLHLQSANAKVVAFRNRAIGTGAVTAALQAASTDTLGYFFWSAANAAPLNNVKYLKVNGVDPLLNLGSYTGILPGSGHAGDPGLSVVSFAGVNTGDYPIWSALRLVSRATVPAGVTAMLTALNVIDPTQHDYITLANLKVWHSHFYINGIGLGTQESNGATINPATPNDLCNPTGSGGAVAEIGGDAGGSNVLKVNNANFCADFGNTVGLINKTQ